MYKVKRHYLLLIAYSAGQLGLFQETLAYISREGSTLQNASIHCFNPKQRKKQGKKRNMLLCYMSDWVTVIDSVHFPKRNIVFQALKRPCIFPKNGLFRVKFSPPLSLSTNHRVCYNPNSQGVSDWFTEVSIYARQILALWSQPMPKPAKFWWMEVLANQKDVYSVW